jgi:O-antigen/teichoic acid export membrane protein
MTTAMLETVRAAPPRIAAHVRAAGHDASSLLLIAQLCTAAAAFATNIFAARGLGPAGRGELALLLQTAYFGSIAVVLGSDRSVVAVYTGTAVSTAARAFVRLLRTPSIIALAAAVAIVVVPTPVPVSWRLKFCVAGLFMITNSLLRAARSVAIIAGQTRQYLLEVELTSDVLQLAGLAWLTVAGVGDSGLWVGVYLLAGTLPAAIWFVRRQPRGEAPPAGGGDGGAEAERVRLRQARREGVQLVPATIARSGTLRVDRLVLAALASTTALGLYASVATLTELIAWPLVAYADSRLGVWRRAHDNHTLSLRRVVACAGGYALVAGVGTGLVIRWLLVPVFGPRYAQALPLVIPLVGAAAVLGVSQLLISVLIARCQAPLASAVETVTLLISGLCYVLLIGRFGALGAACGSLIGYTSCLILAGLALAVHHRRRDRALSVNALPGDFSAQSEVPR